MRWAATTGLGGIVVAAGCSVSFPAPQNFEPDLVGDTAASGGGSTTSGAGPLRAPSSDDGGGDDDGAIPAIDCGGVEYPEGTPLRRHPYLQSIDASSARVAWTSTGRGVGVVRYATSPEGPWTEVEASSTRFDTDYTRDRVDYLAHDATLQGLESGEAYCYEVLEDGIVLARGLSLETAWRGSDRSVRILAFGDSGSLSPQQLGLRDQMQTRHFDVFLHLGDMAYNSGTFVEFETKVFDVYNGLMQTTPTYPAPGNHEYKTDTGQPYRDVYYLWEMALRDEDQERYYSFDYGDVHFVSLDSNSETLLAAAVDEEVQANDDDMLDWLRADLAASDQPWKVAFFHHPPYTSSARAPNVLVRNGLLPVLEDGGVDLALCGHDHHYERTTAIRAGEPTLHQDGGIYYFVVGSGGAGLRTATGDWWTDAVEDQNHVFLDLRIDGCTAHGQAVGIRGQVVDEFELTGC